MFVLCPAEQKLFKNVMAQMTTESVWFMAPIHFDFWTVEVVLKWNEATIADAFPEKLEARGYKLIDVGRHPFGMQDFTAFIITWKKEMGINDISTFFNRSLF